jgi:integrase
MVSTRGSSFQGYVSFKGQRYRRSFQTHAEAERWEAETELQLRAGRPVCSTKDGCPMTLGELRRLTYELHWANTRGERTAEINSQAIVDILGADTEVGDIDAAAIDKVKLELKAAGNTPSTINRKLAALSKMLAVAEDRGIILERPKLRREREAEPRTRFLSLEEERALFDAIAVRDPEIRQLCIFLVETGLRVSEALFLRWSDVDGPLIRIAGTKNDVPRAVPLSQAAAEVLFRRAGLPAPWRGISQSRLNHVWNLAKKDIGLEDDEELVPHSLRHTFASRLIQGGAGLILVKDLLGHRSISMTMRYAHLSPDATEAARGILDRIRKPHGGADL